MPNQLHLPWLALLLASVVLGCRADAPDGERRARAADTSAATRPATPPAAPAAAAPAARDPAAAPIWRRAHWTLSDSAFGPVRPGMRLDELRSAVGAELKMPDRLDPACGYVGFRFDSAGVVLLAVDGRIARIDVHEGAVATTRGVRIGSSEADVRRAYGPGVRSEPHKYTDGHYLIAQPADSAAPRWVFETDGQRVTTFRLGLAPAVHWVEGCS
jgi:hypothetical protein